MDGIQVYGYFPSPEEIKQNEEDARLGIIRYHETTYIERGDCPVELEDELNEYIDKRVAEFERKCQCEYCKGNRKT